MAVYYIWYKDKIYGQPMNKLEAEGKYLRLCSSFFGLELVELPEEIENQELHGIKPLEKLS